jgi:hypothetical protein
LLLPTPQVKGLQEVLLDAFAMGPHFQDVPMLVRQEGFILDLAQSSRGG